MVDFANPAVFPVQDVGGVGGQFANVQAHDARGDGVTDDRAAFVAADALEGPNLIPAADDAYHIASNLTITADRTRFEPGGIIRPASGVTVTFLGEIEAHRHQIFDLSAGGSVVLSSTTAARPEWTGAVGGARHATGCSITSGDATLTRTGGDPFTSADVGKTIYVPGAGASGARLTTTIASFTSATSVELSVTASTTVSAQSVMWGVDDQDAVQWACDHGKVLLARTGYLCGSTVQFGSNFELSSEGGYRGSKLLFPWLPNSGTGSGGMVYFENEDQTNGNSDILIDGLSIEGMWNGTPYGAPGDPGVTVQPVSGFLARLCTDITINNFRVYRSPGISIAHQGCKRLILDNFRVFEGGRDGCTGFGYGNEGASDITISNGIIHTIGDDGMAQWCSEDVNPCTTEAGRPQRIVWTNILIYGRPAFEAKNAGRGIAMAGVNGLTMTNVIVDSTYSRGVMLIADATAGSANFRCKNVRMTNMLIRNAGAAGDGGQPQTGLHISGSDRIVFEGTIENSVEQGIYLANCTKIRLSGEVVDCGTSTAEFGIDLDGTSNVVKNVEDVELRDLTVEGSASAGLRVWYAKNTRIRGCTFRDSGRAGTVGVTSAWLMSGIWAETGAERVSITDTDCTDTRAGGSKTQTYGLYYTNTVIRRWRDNDMSGNATGYVNANGTAYDFNWNHDFNRIRESSGTGSPEGVVLGSKGDHYWRSDGSADSTLYIKITDNTTAFWRNVWTLPPGREGLIALADDSNGGLELGPSNHASASPYIDFHKGVGSAQDFNVRLINSVNRQLTVQFEGGASTGNFKVEGNVEIDEALNHDGTTLGLYGATPVVKPTITGSRGANAALASLLTGLAGQGLITDSTTV